jgi:hypothetical protein
VDAFPGPGAFASDSRPRQSETGFCDKSVQNGRKGVCRRELVAVQEGLLLRHDL